MPIVREVYQDFGYRAVVTSGIDGTHMKGSLHYTGQAFDFRTQGIAQGDILPLVAHLTEALGNEFDVVLERDHIHIEFDNR